MSSRVVVTQAALRADAFVAMHHGQTRVFTRAGVEPLPEGARVAARDGTGDGAELPWGVALGGDWGRD